MENLKTFRHEFKYVIGYQDYLKLRKELEQVLEVDQGHPYMIRSLYFDTYNDDDYYDKQAGVIDRKKVRLRIYGTKLRTAKLEIKSKYDIHQLKESLIVKKRDALRIINEQYEVLDKYDNPLADKISRILKDEGYKPKVIIEYERLAFVSTMGTRITMDYNIKRATDIENFYQEPNYYDIVDGKDIVLEVKFDRFLEPYISDILSKYESRFQSVSKYVLGRNV